MFKHLPQHKKPITKGILVMVYWLTCTLVHAQVASSANYTFSTGTTSNLTQTMNGTPIDMSTQPSLQQQGLSATLATLDIGFDFWFMGTRYTQHTPTVRGVSTLGWLVPATATVNLNGTYTAPVLAPFWMNTGFAPGTLPNLRTKTVGTAPNRCMVFEWRTSVIGSFNANTPASPGGNTPDFIYQMRLYESSGIVEYVYNTMQIPSDYSGLPLQAAIGFTNGSNNSNTLASVTSLSSFTQTTSPASVNNVLVNSATSGAISGLGAGRFFRWTPLTPTAPSGLTFSGVTTTSMTLTWTDNSANEFGFAIYRSDDGGSTYKYIAQNGANVNVFTQTGLQPGISYFYRIFALSEGGLSSALSGSQATSAGGSITSAGSGNWSNPSTWSSGTVPSLTDNVTIADGHTVTIDVNNAVCNNLTVGQGSSGILRYTASGAAGLTAYGNVIVATGATFDAASSNIQTHTLTLGGTATNGAAGNLTVNGIFDMNQVSTPTAGAGVTVTFSGQENGTISGSGSIDFFSVIVNKGNFLIPAQNPVLDVTSVFTMNVPVASASRLTINSGTFRISSATTITPYFGSQTICATAGRLWLNHASSNVSCVGTGTTVGAGTATFNGELRIDNGTFAYGSGNNTASFNATTIGGVTYGAKLYMTGGTFNIFGALQLTSSLGVSFYMSGGNINIDPQAANFLSNLTNVFLIGGSASADWSGGTVTIIDPHSTTSSTATVSLQPGGVKSITGGVLRIGDGTSGSPSGTFGNSTGFSLSISMGVWDLVIDNRVDLSNTRQCRIIAPVTYNASYVNNNLTVNANAYLMLSSGGTAQILGLFGNIVNNGTIGGVEAGSSSVLGTLAFYKASGSQTISGTGSFYNIANLYQGTFNLYATSTCSLEFNQTNNLVVNQVSLVTGTLVHNNKLTIGRTGQIPTVILGGNGLNTPTGTFASVPNFDNTSFNTALTYNSSNANVTIGSKNEIGNSTTTLYNLTVNNTKGITLGRNISVVNALTMTLGDIIIGNNNLTLGSGASNVGTLTYTLNVSGHIICGSSGTFTRWVNTSVAPTSAANTSLYPLGTAGSRRWAYVFYSATNALTTAGTVSVRHDDVQGTSSLTSFTDGALSNIDKRTNSGWIFSTGNGFALTGTISLNLYYEGAAMTNTNVTDVTIADNSGTALGGTYVVGAGTFALPFAVRTGLSAANLTSSTLYIAAPSANLNGVVTAIATGNWGDNSTWNTNAVPTASDNVVIPGSFTVTCASGSGTYSCNNLTLGGNGSTLVMNNVSNTLNVNGGLFMVGKATFTSAMAFLNLSAGTINVTGNPIIGSNTFATGINAVNSILNISGGTLNISTAGNCFRQFSQSGGQFNFSSGNINVFGNFLILGGAFFNQSGGTLTIDANSGSASTSVSGNTTNDNTFSIGISGSNAGTGSATGGTVIIVDPPYATPTASNSAVHSVFVSAASNYNLFTGTHTIQLGDGTSTQTGLNTTNGFTLETYNSGQVALNTVVVNGGSTTGRHGESGNTVSTLYGVYIKNLQINSGSEFIHRSANTFGIGTSLLNNGTLSQITSTALQMGFGNVATLALADEVTLSGSGTFQNNRTTPTASFSNFQVVPNPTTAGVKRVIINVNNLSVSGTLTMSNGILDLGSNNFTLGVTSTNTAGTLTYSAGYIINGTGGRFTRVFPTTGLPTTAATGIGYYPLGRLNTLTNAFENRSAYIYFSTTTALSTGGTISVGHNHSTGNTAVTPFTDGVQTIDTRSNSNWTVDNTGIAASGTIGIRLNGQNINVVPIDLTISTICEASSAAGGTFTAGSGTTSIPSFNRTGMSVANITSKTFYAGIPSANNSGGSIVAITNGYWDQTSTWSTGTVPTNTDGVDIPSPYTVLLGTGSTHTCKTLNVQTGGSFIANGNTLTISNQLSNGGTMTMGGASIVINNGNTSALGLINTGTINMISGSMRIGPTGGGAARFTNTGTFTFSDGTVTVNGNYAQTLGAFTMTSTGNATLVVDGNDGSSAAGSVPWGTDLFSITSNTGTITGGTITIVDPPFEGTGRAFNVISGTSWTGNTLNIGDGSSTSNGTSYFATTNNPSTGFRLQSSTLNMGTVNIRGGNTARRWASICNIETFTCANLVIHNNSELRTITNSTSTLAVTGNLTLSSGAALIISQAGTLQFNGTATQTVSGAGSFFSDTARANTGQINNLTINNSSGTGVDISAMGNITIGFGTTSSGTLTLTSGPLNIGTNTLTLGTSGTALGTLSGATGTAAIIHGSGGSFRRWISATAAPTSVATTSQYPLGVLVGGTLMRRDLWIFYSSATLTGGTAGTLAASHTSSGGLTAVSSFTDGSLSGVDTRTNSGWNVTSANSFNNGSATLSVRAQGTGMISPTTVSNINLMGQTAALSGTHGIGTGTTNDPLANRTGVSLADVTNVSGLYIGGPGSNLFVTIQSVASGNWSNTATWSTGTVPTSTDNVIINANHAITLDANGNTRDLTLNSGSQLTINSNTLTVNTNLTNTSGNISIGGGTLNVLGSAAANGVSSSGTINLSSGTVNLGQSPNFNRTFTSSGTLIVSGGNLNVNGNLNVSGGTFTQSGGTITVDGNDGSSAGGSVASGTALLAMNATTQNVTGGSTLIVDPPYTGTAASFSTASSTSFVWTGHTLQLGDGSSTHAGSSSTVAVGSVNNTLGFNLITSSATTGGIRLFNVLVNGGSGTNRFVTAPTSTAQSLSIGNTLTINSGSELRTCFGTSAGGANINVGGNITNNGTLVTGSFTTLALRLDGSSASPNEQVISGSGTFTNAISGSAGRFSNLLVNNTNTNGITISGIGNITIDDVNGTTPTLTLTSGYLKLGTNNITIGSSVTKPGAIIAGLYSGSTGNGNTGIGGAIATTGSITRWFGTTAISFPTVGGGTISNAGLFPFAVVSSPTSFARSLAIANTSTFTSGGTITVSHSDASGTNSMTPFSDGGATVDTRTNFNWTISTGNGIAVGGATLNIRTSGSGLQSGSFSNLANLRITAATAAASGTAGTNLNTFTDPVVERTGFDLTTLASTFYVGGPGVPTSIANNNISSSQTICSGTAPSTLTGSLPTGGIGSYNYQWQVSTTSATAGFSDIISATTQNYTAGTLTSTTWYRRYVVSGSYSDTSSSVQITVNNTNNWLGATNTDWATASNWQCGYVPTATSDVVINAGPSNMPVISDGGRTCNNITIGSGASLTLNNSASELIIKGTLTNNGTLTITDGDMEFNGTTAQVVPSGTYRKITVNNTAGVSLGGHVNMSGDLDFQAGTITLGNFNLTITGTSGLPVNYNSSKFVITNGNGFLTIQNIGSGARTGSITFPVAHAGSAYNPVVLSNSGTSDAFSVKAELGVSSTYSGNAQTGTAITADAVNRTWYVNEGTPGGSNVTLTLQWGSSAELSGFNRTSCYVGHYTASGWIPGTAVAAAGSDPFTVSRSGITSFSPFGVGEGGGPLPVEWLSFTGKPTGEHVELNWTTATEINNSHFVVERSTDARTFTVAGEVKGSGNSNTPLNYNYTDADAFGNATTLYYRLKQVDFDGAFAYSNVIAVSNAKQGKGVTIEAINPNPFTHELNIQLNNVSEGNVTVEVVDLNGRKLYNHSQATAQGTLTLDLSSLSALAKGVYLLHVRNGNTLLTQKLVKLQ